MSLKELKYMLGSTTHVIEDINFMEYCHIDIVNSTGDGMNGNPLVEVCTSNNMMSIPS